MVNQMQLKKIYVNSVLLIFLAVGPLLAQLSVEPTAMELSCGMDQKGHGSFFVSQSGDINLPVKVTVEWLKAEQETQTSAFPTLTVYPEEFLLKPGEKKEIAVSWNPDSALSSETAYMVYFSGAPHTDGRTALIPRIGCAVYAFQSRSAIWSVKDTSIRLVRDEKRNGYEFNICLTNIGNVHLVPEGFLILKDSAGTRVGYLKFERERPLLATESISYRTFWPGIHKSGTYSGAFIVYYGPGDTEQKLKLAREFKFSISELGEIIQQ
jgi:hypothetical protein